ncbi:unnamed protein product, partial [Meganyctiphanes norvegica]
MKTCERGILSIQAVGKKFQIPVSPLRAKCIEAHLLLNFESVLAIKGDKLCFAEVSNEKKNQKRISRPIENEVKKMSCIFTQRFNDMLDYFSNIQIVHHELYAKQNILGEILTYVVVHHYLYIYADHEFSTMSCNFKAYKFLQPSFLVVDIAKSCIGVCDDLTASLFDGGSLFYIRRRKKCHTGPYHKNRSTIKDVSQNTLVLNETHCCISLYCIIHKESTTQLYDRTACGFMRKANSPFFCGGRWKPSYRQSCIKPLIATCILNLNFASTAPRTLSNIYTKTSVTGNKPLNQYPIKTGYQPLLLCDQPQKKLIVPETRDTADYFSHLVTIKIECSLATTKRIFALIKTLQIYITNVNFYYLFKLIKENTNTIDGDWTTDRICTKQKFYQNIKKIMELNLYKRHGTHSHNLSKHSCLKGQKTIILLLLSTLCGIRLKNTKSLNLSLVPSLIYVSFKLRSKKALEVIIFQKCFKLHFVTYTNLMTLVRIYVLFSQVIIQPQIGKSHTWFGIIIGAQDWTEEWLSEGFATYMEDSLYALAALAHQMNHNSQTQKTPKPLHCNGSGSNAAEGIYAENYKPEEDQKDNTTSMDDTDESNSFELTPDLLEELSELRAHLRYKTLAAELEHSQDELQTMRPMQGENLKDEIGVNYVKNGMNPEKAFLQVHYLKGYFLLKYLSKHVSRGRFDAMIKHFVSRFHGQLVLSEEFLELVEGTFPNLVEQGITKDKLLTEWLHQPGLNNQIPEMYRNISNSLITQINNHFTFWAHRMRSIKSAAAKKFKLDNPETLKFPDQVVLLFEHFLELPKIPVKVMEEISCYYNVRLQNADVRHRWCELAIKHNFSDMSEIERFLVADQSMGVYLYGELIISGKKRHRTLAEKVYSFTCKEMDESSRVTVFSMLHGK